MRREEHLEELVSWHRRFQTFAQKQSIFQYYFVPVCSFNDFRQTKDRRVFTLYRFSSKAMLHETIKPC